MSFSVFIEYTTFDKNLTWHLLETLETGQTEENLLERFEIG